MSPRVVEASRCRRCAIAIKALFLCLATLAAGCGSPLKAVGRDASPPDGGGLAALCTGDVPRMVVNGAGLTPMITAYPIVMDCCDGGAVVVTSDRIAFPVGVSWIVEISPTYALPATIDLSNPPPSWYVEVATGCGVTLSDCGGAADYYLSGLVGWLTVAQDPSYRFDMDVCVHVEEDPAKPASLLHSLDLYVPHALTS